MRGEVAILTRNVVIEGVDQDGWGGQVLTTDIFETTGNFRYGLTVLDSVEIRNCSQRDTDRAAVRFELANMRYSRVKDVSIHGGLGWGVQIKDSSNIEFKDVTVINFH